MDHEDIIEADLTWVDDAFEPNVQVMIGATGLIEQVGFLDRKPTLRLPGRALLPGMVNAHSHAFQRGLRGIAEAVAVGPNPFLAWREALYELVECVGAEEFRNLSRMAFEEMLHHGITTVGEFHYFHHPRGGNDYAFDDILLEAAAAAGIRLVLLCCFYAHGGIGQPLAPEQARFDSGDVETFCRHVENLRQRVDGRRQFVGIAAHSFRAAAPEEVARLAAYARLSDLPFHINVESLRGEVDDCRAVYGGSPIELMLQRNLLGPHVTLVHATHTPGDVLRAAAAAGANLCVCPTTEGNLGLGWADVAAFGDAGGKVCLGTDSNVRISMNEEMRWLEYTQRARRETRGVCIDAHGRAANAIWRCATVRGAEALKVRAGRIAPGLPADLFAIDTQGLSLLGSTPESLLAAFITGSDRAAITHTCVGGTWHTWKA